MIIEPCSPWEPQRRRKRTHATGVYPIPTAVLLPDEGQSNALHGCTRVKHRVSACKPLCAIFIEAPSVYSLSGVKTNVSHLWKDVQSWIEMEL